MSSRPFRFSFFVGLALLFTSDSHAQYGQVIFQKDSLYQRILVYRDGDIVSLRFARSPRAQVQSQSDLGDLRRHTLEYTTLAFAGLLYQPEPKRILVLGLGGGTIPREMHYYFPDAEIDVVELDADIPPVAETFFQFKTDDTLKVHVSDGRVFIRKRNRSGSPPLYDYVMLDAFNSQYIPFHLMTREFLEEVKGALTDDGVVVANVFSDNRLFDAEFRTFLDVFGECQVYRGATSTNAMLISTKTLGRGLTPAEAERRAVDLQVRQGFSFDPRLVARRLVPGAKPHPDARILTDDRAPVNRLRDQPRDE
jgi:spermidine synthase